MLSLLFAALLPTFSVAAPSAWGLPDNGGSHHHGGPPGHDIQPHRGGWTHHWAWDNKKAVYFLRVDPAGSNIVAIELGSDGKLMDSTSVTSTGGVGLQSINASAPGMPRVSIDPLQGQQAVTIGGNHLFTVNSGSNTAAMFEINPHDPLKLEMVGNPAPTLGEFAMSIAYSSKYQKACVLSGGAVNGISCFNVDAKSGLSPDGVGLRKFGFDYVTPAELMGPKGSGSDIQFSGDSSKLIATLKGDTKPKATLGHTIVLNVNGNGEVASTWTDNMIEPLEQPFGFALDGNDLGSMYISDVLFGGALVSLDPDTNKISVDKVVNETSLGAAAASCWAVWSRATEKFYDINAGAPSIGVVSSESGKLEDMITYNSKLAGAVDTVVDGRLAYALTAVNVVAVLDLETGKTVQEFTYGNADNRPFWTGMAMYPADPLLSGGV